MEDYIIAENEAEFIKLAKELNPCLTEKQLDDAMNDGEYEYNGCVVAFD